MAIHQLLAGARMGDAITNEAAVLASIFRRRDERARLFAPAATIDRLLGVAVEPLSRLAVLADPGRDTVLLHLSIGSPVQRAFAEWPGRRIILYHNMTPPAWFAAINPATSYLLEQGRAEVAALAPLADRVWADSAFNARELQQLGYGRVDVFPLVLPLESLRVAPARRISRMWDDGRMNILFVGRGAPNKRFEDLIRVQACLERWGCPSRLLLVGSFGGTEIYGSVLLGLVRALRLEHVHFEGARSQAELNGYYASADLFLCLSEHEGFCAPLIEAMHFAVPIVAYAAAAVPETLDGAGLLIRDKSDPGLVAAALWEVHTNAGLRQSLLLRQAERLARYASRDVAAELDLLLA